MFCLAECFLKFFCSPRTLCNCFKQLRQHVTNTSSAHWAYYTISVISESLISTSVAIYLRVICVHVGFPCWKCAVLQSHAFEPSNRVVGINRVLEIRGFGRLSSSAYTWCNQWWLVLISLVYNNIRYPKIVIKRHSAHCVDNSILLIYLCCWLYAFARTAVYRLCVHYCTITVMCCRNLETNFAHKRSRYDTAHVYKKKRIRLNCFSEKRFESLL